MSNSAASEFSGGPATLEVERAGRRFPEVLASSKTVPQNRIRKLLTRQQDDELPGLIAEAIHDRLPWQTIRAFEETSRDAIIAAYVESLRFIDRCRTEVDATIYAACRANLEFRQGIGATNTVARDRVQAAQLKSALDDADVGWLPSKNIATAELMSKPLNVYREKLADSLEAATQDFARQLFATFARLVDRQLFGLVEWLPNHCCRYHFFKHVVIQDNTGESEIVLGTEYFDQVSERESVSGLQIVGNQSIERTRSGTHHFRFARHEHEVINAVRTSIRNSTVVVPPPVVGLIEAVPEWLYPCVEVIDGDLIRERIIERDTGVEDWQQAEVFDEPIIGCEPGVIIGPYVLSGWGPREVESELLRRQSVAEVTARDIQRSAATYRGPLFAVLAAGLGMISLWGLTRVMRGEGGTMFVVLAVVAALGTLWQGLHDFALKRRSPTAALHAHLMTLFVGSVLMLAFWCVARWYQPMFWVTPLMLGGIAIAARSFAIRFN